MNKRDLVNEVAKVISTKREAHKRASLVQNCYMKEMLGREVHLSRQIHLLWR